MIVLRTASFFAHVGEQSRKLAYICGFILLMFTLLNLSAPVPIPVLGLKKCSRVYNFMAEITNCQFEFIA